MQLVVWLKDASLFDVEQIEKRIRLIKGVMDVVAIIGDEPMRLTQRAADGSICPECLGSDGYHSANCSLQSRR